MIRLARKSFLAHFCTGLLAQQFPPPEKEEKAKRLPDGTLQSEAILKDEQKKMLADAARLIQYSQEVETELKKNDHNILSIGMLKKLEEIEKLARRMRGRHNR
jgi:hypothetical protein